MAAHQSPVPGILQARVLEWGAIAFSALTINYMREKLAITIASKTMKYLKINLTKKKKKEKPVH